MTVTCTVHQRPWPIGFCIRCQYGLSPNSPYLKQFHQRFSPTPTNSQIRGKPQTTVQHTHFFSPRRQCPHASRPPPRRCAPTGPRHHHRHRLHHVLLLLPRPASRPSRDRRLGALPAALRRQLLLLLLLLLLQGGRRGQLPRCRRWRVVPAVQVEAVSLVSSIPLHFSAHDFVAFDLLRVDGT